jgi:hypothetical protein
LNGTAALFQAMAPGIATFVKGLLDAANIGGAAFGRLGAALGTVFDQLGGVFTRLAENGTIKAAVDGLSSVIIGLGNVLGPVIELLIRMGAALGPTLGSALTDLGNTIQTSIPFFEHLAQVAGGILVRAFEVLGPAVRDLITQLLPGANQGLDGFANVINNVVIPAVGDFIRNIPNMIESIKQFFLAATASALSFASTFLGAISGILGVLHDFFAAMALIPGPMQKSFAQAAATTDAFKGKVDELKTGVDGLHDKTVKLQLQTQGADAVKAMQASVDGVKSKVVSIISKTLGIDLVLDMKNQIALTNSKKVDVTATVPDTPKIVDMHNQIALTNSKSVSVTASVPDTPKVVDMKNQIALTNSKTVQVTANVSGTSAVQALVSAINAVHNATSTVTTYLRTVVQKFADGGRVPTGNQSFLVGERGPELLSLDALGGVVTPAARTRQILADSRARDGQVDAASGRAGSSDGAAPITVNVMLSQEQIAGIAQVEIARRDRSTKRAVLAGSGVTF